MKRILGLDLGTNSIGWAVVEIDYEKHIVRIIALGSRILPMDAGEISTFESGGKLKSSAADRTESRGARRLNERFLLRRDRLHCILNLINALPEHYKLEIEFENEKGMRSGKFRKGREVKFAYEKGNDGKYYFLFMDAYNEMVNDFKANSPCAADLFREKVKKGKTFETKIPYDWTLYYLRKKALSCEITKEELAWITLSFNQKRGYEKTIGQDEKKQKEGELSEKFVGKVSSVENIGQKDGLNIYEIKLKDNINDSDLFKYKEESSSQITRIGDLKVLTIVRKYNEDGDIEEKNTTYTINEIRSMRVVDVKSTFQKNKENTIYNITLENGWIKEQQSKYFPKWKDTVRDLIIKTNYDKDGNRIVKGKDKGRNISSPSEDDWTLMKLKTESSITEYNSKHKINNDNNTVGIASYIYDTLLINPSQKIIGDLVSVVDRDYYQKELEAIYKCQKEYHSELRDTDLYQKAIYLLYPHNETHRNVISKIGFPGLITDDILMYQRDLKTKKSLIADCPYETKKFYKKDTKNGNLIVDENGNKKLFIEHLKATHKANPYYQEFRLLQFIKRLRIIKLEDVQSDGTPIFNKDVTNDQLTIGVKEKLFVFLNNREKIDQKALLKHLKLPEKEYTWNFEQDHEEPCNKTRYDFILRTKRIKGFDWQKFLSFDNEYRLWHFFYSVKKEEEFNKGLTSILSKCLESMVKSAYNESADIHEISSKTEMVKEKYLDSLIMNFKSFSGYSNDYGSYSEKAIKKLLPLMRFGKYWDKEAAESVLLESVATEIKDKVLKKENINGEIEDFQGLWLSSACYLIYGRYSEVGDVKYWKTPDDITNFLQNEFKQHSLNNPVVEKVLREMLQVVKDIWVNGLWTPCGIQNEDGSDNMNEIHIELAREMKKNNAQKIKAINDRNENKKINDRIIEILKELKSEYNNISPQSTFQQDKLKIVETDLLSKIQKDKDTTQYEFKTKKGQYITKKELREITSKDVSKVSKKDIERYRLWLDQRYISPYTGRRIKLSDLFDREKYEIEHIFPKQRVTLNALCNKVISETEINKEKGARTGYQFILDCHGQKKIKCKAHEDDHDGTLISPPDDYKMNVNQYFTDSKKREILLSKEIPSDFTNSQLNNTQQIAKVAMGLLSNLVREKGEDSFRSKNVLPINGTITTRLKRDWNMNEAWNKIIQPRFERLNKLTSSNLFGQIEKVNGHDVFRYCVPEQLAADFDPKRIDHRHHAMDALAIALATECHVQYLNNIYSADDAKDAKKKLATRMAIRNKYMFSEKKEDKEKEVRFLPPAQTKVGDKIIQYRYCYQNSEIKTQFKDAAFEALQNALISFKQKNRIIRQRTNKYSTYNVDDKKIELVKDENRTQKSTYSIRQSLHKDTCYGLRFQRTVSLEDAIADIDKIVSGKLRNEINKLKSEKYKNEEIVKKLEGQYPTVYIYEKCLSTRYGNSLESFADSKDINDTIKKVTDIAIQRILEKHLHKYDTIAVSLENIEPYIDVIISDAHKTAIKEQIEKELPLTETKIEDKKLEKTAIFISDFQSDFDKDDVQMNPQLAFSADGVKELNTCIKELNGGKYHKPIYAVRLFTTLGKQFPVAEDGVKSSKYVVTDGDSNQFCGVYHSSSDATTRNFYVPTLRELVTSLKEGYEPCNPTRYDEKNNECVLDFILSPLDLVYLPTQEEIETPNLVDINNLTKEQKSRIYKLVDCNDKKINFVPYYIASPLIDTKKEELEKFGISNIKFIEKTKTKDGVKEQKKDLVNEIGLGTSDSKNQNSFEDDYMNCVHVKKTCWKLKVDRLGSIIEIIR